MLFSMMQLTFSRVVQPWIQKVLDKLPADKKDEFKEKSQAGIKFIMGKLKELQL